MYTLLIHCTAIALQYCYLIKKNVERKQIFFTRFVKNIVLISYIAIRTKRVFRVLVHRRVATALITASLPEGSARRCEGQGVFKSGCCCCCCRWEFQHGESWAVGQDLCAFTRAATASWSTAAFVSASPLPPFPRWNERRRRAAARRCESSLMVC